MAARSTDTLGGLHGWIHARDLLAELVVRDIKLRYRGSLLGILWTLLNPLAELLVLLFVFRVVLRVDIENFPAHLFVGLLVYGWFQTSLNSATGSIVGNRELVRRPGVAVWVLPAVIVASNLVHLILSLPILLGLLLFTGIPLTGALFFLPVLLIIEFVLILGFAYPVATIHVWFRDTQHVLRVALQLLFYLTPIFYGVQSVPEGLRRIYLINPMAHVVEAFRDVLMRGTVPELSSVVGLALASAALLGFSLLWFLRTSHRFVDEL
jgi:lipopolysaccharide transport system permease protein